MPQLSTPLLPRLFPKLVTLLVIIGLAAAGRKAYVLLIPPLAPRFAAAAALDSGFAAHRVLTFIHIVPASLVIVLMPLQFIGRVRQRYPDVHRWSGRLVLILGLVVGVSALVMGQTMAIGGANEAAATFLFAVLFLLFLGLGFRDIRQGRVRRHREWMIRAFGVLLGIATTRPIVAAFFAAGRLSPHEFFGTAFWLGFTLTLLAAEAWIHCVEHRAGSEDRGPRGRLRFGSLRIGPFRQTGTRKILEQSNCRPNRYAKLSGWNEPRESIQ